MGGKEKAGGQKQVPRPNPGPSREDGGDLLGWDGVTHTGTLPSPLERCCLLARSGWGCWDGMLACKTHGPGWDGTPPGWRGTPGQDPQPGWQEWGSLPRLPACHQVPFNGPVKT